MEPVSNLSVQCRIVPMIRGSNLRSSIFFDLLHLAWRACIHSPPVNSEKNHSLKCISVPLLSLYLLHLPYDRLQVSNYVAFGCFESMWYCICHRMVWVNFGEIKQAIWYNILGSVVNLDVQITCIWVKLNSEFTNLINTWLFRLPVIKIPESCDHEYGRWCCCK